MTHEAMMPTIIFYHVKKKISFCIQYLIIVNNLPPIITLFPDVELICHLAKKVWLVFDEKS